MSARPAAGTLLHGGGAGIEWAAFSESGGSGSPNEDYVLCDDEIGLFLVADGMGGRPEGRVASQMGAEAFAAELKALDARSRLNPEALQEIVNRVNVSLRGQATERPSLRGMGTTLTALIAAESHGRIVHVGDSRAYRRRGGQLAQLTEDHTLVQELVQRNHLSPDDASEHPMRHVLARTLGGQRSVEAQILDISLRPDDLFLLATDGLKALADAELARILSSRRWRTGATSLARAIRKAAQQAAPADDVSVIVAVAAVRPGRRGGFLGAGPNRRRAEAVSFATRTVPAEAWKGREGQAWKETIAADIVAHLLEIAQSRAKQEDARQEQQAALVKRLLGILEVLDAFERVFANVEAKKDLCTPQMKIWVGNFRTVYRLLRRLLSEDGVVPVEQLYQGFDPKWHEVSEKVFDPDRPEGAIVKEIRRGYLRHGQILRRSLVVVTTREAPPGETPGEREGETHDKERDRAET